MLRPQVIDPFPEDIDRDGFGHWLAGFTDGEGCFCLPYTRNRKRTDAYTPSARFTINLRADDAVILYTIQSYWRKGRVSVNPLIDKRNPNPHIVFHVCDEGYFPGPDVWGAPPPSRASTPTSGITQPPVLGYVLRRLFEEARDHRLAEEKARALLPKAAAWHRWFHAARDPGGSGLVAIIHPWESGRDNSID